MTAPRSIWNRVSDYFRPNGSLNLSPPVNGAAKSNGHSPNHPSPPTNGHRPDPADREEPSIVSGSIEIERSGPRSPKDTWWSRRQRREIMQRETSQRVTEVMDSMRQHFQRQDDRGDQLIASMNTVAQVLADLAANQKAQSESIHQIASQVQIAARHTEILTDTLSRVPQAMHTQSETLRAIGQRIEAAKDTDVEMTQSLRSFGQAVDSLRTASATQVDTLQRLHSNETEQRAALTSLVRTQSRLFLAGMIVAGVLGLAALGTMGFVLWMQLGTRI